MKRRHIYDFIPDHSSWTPPLVAPEVSMKSSARSVLKYSALAALAGSLMACSSKSPTGEGKQTGTGNGTCSPDSEIPCYVGLAEPCAGLNSGFDGDEFCLAPPDEAL